jgi:histidinol-phosphate/aromatic aminotransferase/cobyric acid decarboxylase-like protein
MNISANWMYFFAILGGLLAAFRIWQNLQKLRRQRNDSWDARLIDQLRKRGSDPFKPHDVDFFLAFPTQDAAEDLARQLRSEGFDADVVDEPESGELRWSLHAHKSMQLTVPDMQELSRRLSVAATAKLGRYDGWSAKQVPKPADIADRMR